MERVAQDAEGHLALPVPQRDGQQTDAARIPVLRFKVRGDEQQVRLGYSTVHKLIHYTLKAKLKAELDRLRELKKKKANANASADAMHAQALLPSSVCIYIYIYIMIEIMLT